MVSLILIMAVALTDNRNKMSEFLPYTVLLDIFLLLPIVLKIIG